jgi:hypothetical protein
LASPVAIFAALAALAAAAAAGGALFAPPRDLLPGVRSALWTLLRALEAVGIRVKVGARGRSLAAQAAAFDAGRSATKSGAHQKGRAVDLYPIDPDTGFPDYAGRNLELFRRMHAVASGLGWHGLAFNPDGSRRLLEGGNGRRFWDGGHLEWRGAA